jgi:hypothetical protein
LTFYSADSEILLGAGSTVSNLVFRAGWTTNDAAQIKSGNMLSLEGAQYGRKYGALIGKEINTTTIV